MLVVAGGGTGAQRAAHNHDDTGEDNGTGTNGAGHGGLLEEGR
jgi:hypothetical protein